MSLIRTSFAALAVLALGAVSACSAAGQDTAAGGPPKPGGTLRLAVEKEPECLDPHQSPTEAARLFDRPLVDSLVYQDETGALHPWLAQRWTISPDRLTYTFELRDGVTFTDGAPFDAAAVVANLDHVVAPATKSLLASSLITAYESARAVAPGTVEVRLKRPDSTFLSALATVSLGMESPRTLTQDPAQLCSRVVGTGPFHSPDGFQPQQGIKYVRNPAYNWPPEGAGHAGTALLDGIDLQVAPDDAARYGALTSGQVDAVVGVPQTDIRELGSSPGFALHDKPYPGVNYSYWPNTASGPFADPLVRKAFRTGVNWGQIVQNVHFGTAEVARGVLTPSTPGYAADLERSYVHDPGEAGRLLDQAGWTARDSAGYRTKNGVRLTVRHLWSDPSIADLAVQVQAAAKELGIEVVQENLDGGTFVNRLLAGDYDVIDTGFSAPGPSVLQVMFGQDNIPTRQRGVANNMARYAEPGVQADFQRALDATDLPAQFRVYGDIQRRITEDAAVFPVYSDRVTLGTRSGVQNVKFDTEAVPGFYEIWLES